MYARMYASLNYTLNTNPPCTFNCPNIKYTNIKYIKYKPTLHFYLYQYQPKLPAKNCVSKALT